MKDLNNLVSKALPAAAATAHSDSLDLGALTVGPVAGGLLEAQIKVPATADLVEAKDIDIEFEDSADNVTFVAVPGTGNFKVTGAAAAAGGSETVFRFYLPPGTRRYIRVSPSVESGGGDNTAVSVELALVC